MAKTVSKPSISIKRDPTAKNVSSSTSTSAYKSSPGPRDKVPVQAT